MLLAVLMNPDDGGLALPVCGYACSCREHFDACNGAGLAVSLEVRTAVYSMGGARLTGPAARPADRFVSVRPVMAVKSLHLASVRPSA